MLPRPDPQCPAPCPGQPPYSAASPVAAKHVTTVCMGVYALVRQPTPVSRNGQCQVTVVGSKGITCMRSSQGFIACKLCHRKKQKRLT
jgi:hypothetical protein